MASDREIHANWQTIRERLHAIQDRWEAGETEEDVLIILDHRAETLARSAEERERFESTLNALRFRLGGEWYAIPIQQVQAIRLMTTVTPVPCVPSYYVGVVNLHGRITSVLDLQVFLGLASDHHEHNLNSQNLIVARSGRIELAILADEVDDTMDIPLERMEDAPSNLLERHNRALAGMMPDGLLVLDVEALFSDDRLIIREEIR